MAINTAASRAYRKAMVGYAAIGNLAQWYSRIDVEDVLAEWRTGATPKEVERAERNIAKAQTKDSLRAFSKLTEVVDGELRIVAEPPVLVPVHDLVAPPGYAAVEEIVRGMIRSYRSTLSPDRRQLLERYRYVDGARKVVGVGSVGTRAWIALMVGRDEQDPLFLQFKEAEASVLEPFLGLSGFENHGQRVVEGQRLTQGAGDIMLGWLRTTGPDGVDRDYYVRQLWDHKGSALVDLMRAHARAGDSVAIAAYLGRGDTFDRALAQFGEAYADQNELDYATVREAAESGQIAAPGSRNGGKARRR
jgi:hypothetical protein